MKSTLLKEKEDKWLLIKKTRQLKIERLVPFVLQHYTEKNQVFGIKTEKVLFFILFFYVYVLILQFNSILHLSFIHLLVGWLVGKLVILYFWKGAFIFLPNKIPPTYFAFTSLLAIFHIFKFSRTPGSLPPPTFLFFFVHFFILSHFFILILYLLFFFN